MCPSMQQGNTELDILSLGSSHVSVLRECATDRNLHQPILQLASMWGWGRPIPCTLLSLFRSLFVLPTKHLERNAARVTQNECVARRNAAVAYHRAVVIVDLVAFLVGQNQVLVVLLARNKQQEET